MGLQVFLACNLRRVQENLKPYHRQVVKTMTAMVLAMVMMTTLATMMRMMMLLRRMMMMIGVFLH